MTTGARDRGDDGATGGDPRAAQCPHCHGRGRPGERYCLRCRCEFATGVMPAPVELVPFRKLAPRAARWEAHIDVDRDYFVSGQSDGLRYPTAVPTRVVVLTDDRVVVGRRSRSGGVYPQVDLSALTEDPGVSAVHAYLEPRPDGSLRLIDPGSLNGTRLNGGTTPIPLETPVPLRNGDQIFVGAWSRITVLEVES